MTDGLQYLSLARKAGLAELGEEPVGSVTRAGGRSWPLPPLRTPIWPWPW